MSSTRLAPAVRATRFLLLSGLSVAVVATLVACDRTETATSKGSVRQAVVAPPSEVVIMGEIEKTYTPVEVVGVRIGSSVGINLNESDLCGVTIQFPGDLQSGKHQIDDRLHQITVDVFGEYGVLCDRAGILTGAYRSTAGIFTLLDAGGPYSGSFEFTAAKVGDESKTIRVSGSFDDVSLR